jgi:hypothetical protein
VAHRLAQVPRFLCNACAEKSRLLPHLHRRKPNIHIAGRKPRAIPLLREGARRNRAGEPDVGAWHRTRKISIRRSDDPSTKRTPLNSPSRRTLEMLRTIESARSPVFPTARGDRDPDFEFGAVSPSRPRSVPRTAFLSIVLPGSDTCPPGEGAC